MDYNRRNVTAVDPSTYTLYGTRKKIPRKNGPGKNGPWKNVLQKCFSVERMLGNLNDF